MAVARVEVRMMAALKEVVLKMSGAREREKMAMAMRDVKFGVKWWGRQGCGRLWRRRW